MVREFEGFIARKVPEVISTDGVPPHMQKFLLSRAQVEHMTARLPGKPICGEHAENVSVGRVLAARITSDGDWQVKFALNDDPAGKEAAAFVDMGHTVSLSLQHDSSDLEPIEVTLCQLPAREGSIITAGRNPLTSTNIPVYNDAWERIKATRRVKATQPNPSIICATLPPPASPMSSSSGAPAAPAATSAPATPAGAGGPAPPAAAAAPPTSGGGVTMLSSPPAPPPPAQQQPPAAVPPPAPAAPANQQPEAAVDPNDPVQQLGMSMLNVVSTRIATTEERQDLVTRTEAMKAAHEKEKAENARLRDELEATRQAQNTAAEAYRRNISEARHRNERDGMIPPGTASQMDRDYGHAQRAIAAASGGGGAPAASPSPSPAAAASADPMDNPDFINRLVSFKTSLLKHSVPPQAPGSFLSGASRGSAMPPPAAPQFPAATAAAGGPPPSSSSAPAHHHHYYQAPMSHMPLGGAAAGPGYASPHMFPVGSSGPMGSYVNLGQVGGSGFTVLKPTVAAAHPGEVEYGTDVSERVAVGPTTRVAASMPPVVHKKMCDEGIVSPSSLLPSGRTLYSPGYSDGAARVKASRLNYKGLSLMGGKDAGSYAYDGISPDQMFENHRRSGWTQQMQVPDLTADRAQALGWGNAARSVGRIFGNKTGAMGSATTLVPPVEYFPPSLRLHPGHPVMQLFLGGSNCADATRIKDLIPEHVLSANRAALGGDHHGGGKRSHSSL